MTNPTSGIGLKEDLVIWNARLMMQGIEIGKQMAWDAPHSLTYDA